MSASAATGPQRPRRTPAQPIPRAGLRAVRGTGVLDPGTRPKVDLTRRPNAPRAARSTPARTARPQSAAAPRARRTPFIALVLVLIGSGLVALLVLNTAIAADSFTRQALVQDIDQLTVQEQELQVRVAAAQAPGALAAAAAAQGMIPAGEPGFVVIGPDGTTQVVGQAEPAQRPKPPAAAGRQDQPVRPPTNPDTATPGGAPAGGAPAEGAPADGAADPAAPGTTDGETGGDR